ncbi:MAG: NADP-dependent isocitrate dehydrogenase [Spirochaetaceae bacterium]|jgi:isocitrate dehydrogenase|nr:NADP-dependent isocitrate dehydrogenase [Spirochaetaceae bacterium]
MTKITMTRPIVEMDGDEMARVLWGRIKEELLLPFVDLRTAYYDLGLPNRDATSDAVTREAARAVTEHKVGVKCATITPNLRRLEEYRLKKLWPSPNATIRAFLDGTVFREPIMVRCVKPAVRSWAKPIVIARHAYGDVYGGLEYRVEEAGKAELVFTTAAGREVFRQAVHTFEGPGVLQAAHNKDGSIGAFARACFSYALETRRDLWFAAKDTISACYDRCFRDIFERVFEAEYAPPFKDAGLTYRYALIDDAAARAVRSEGGFVWACKNYDGDVLSDLVSAAFGSLAMMTSVLVSPEGYFEYEAAHGTVSRHYYRYLRGEETSTNPTAMIFAWTSALRKRGELDHTPELSRFADVLEGAVIKNIEAGAMTGDLFRLREGVFPDFPCPLSAEAFIGAVREETARAY